MNRSDFAAIVLAAGRGSRMGSDVPKVLLPLCGRPMLAYVLDTLKSVGIARPIVVVSADGAEPIRNAIGDGFALAIQEKQLGSGHAAMCAADVAADSDNVLVMCGDSPLFTSESALELMKAHTAAGAQVTLTAAFIADPTGYGRILRDETGRVVGIVEDCEADEEQRAIAEINGGLYAFDGGWLWDHIRSTSPNEAGEYCLTDMVGRAVSQGRCVASIQVPPDEVAGVNTPVQLRHAERILCSRLKGGSPRA